MKLTKLMAGVLFATLLVTTAFAADKAVKATNAPVAVTTTPTPASDWVFTLGGTGSTTTTHDSQSALGLNFSVGKTESLLGASEEIGLRQGLNYDSANDGSVVLSSKAYADVTVYTFNLTQTVPVTLFVGGNAGAAYGNTPLRWTAGPEVGGDVWLAKNVAIDGRVGYDFDLNPAKSQNTLNYFIGAKFTF